MEKKNYRHQIQDLYLKGFNAVEICSALSLEGQKEIDRVRKYIQRNFKEFKKAHEFKVKQRKDVLKVLDYENKRFMSDKCVVKKNPSAYRNDSRGDLVRIKEEDFVFPQDMPKKLRNVDGREYQKSFYKQRVKIIGDCKVRITSN